MLRFLLFVGGVMMAGASMAEGISTCSGGSVPIEIEFAAFVDDPEFPDFVTVIEKHIETKLAEAKLCIASAKSKERSQIRFVHWLFFTPENRTLVPAPPLDVCPANGCCVSSPWIDIAIERKPVPWIRAVIRFNERQLITDQAILAGAYNVPQGIAMPLTASEYRRFVREFQRSLDGSKATTKRIEERIPPDLLWLFRRSRGDTYGGGNMGQVMINGGAEGYTKLVIKLIDRCFPSMEGGANLNSVYDVGDHDPLFLGQYMINMPVLRYRIPHHSVQSQRLRH